MTSSSRTARTHRRASVLAREGRAAMGARNGLVARLSLVVEDARSLPTMTRSVSRRAARCHDPNRSV